MNRQLMFVTLTTALLLCFVPISLAANVVTGVVHNESRGLPAAGDEVILIRIENGMQQEASAMTDAHGAFVLKIPHLEGPHIVRVIHQNVNYDQEVSGGEGVSIPVFDASYRVPEITGTIEILRAETQGSLLHVSDMYEIKNASRPSLTQAGENTFEVYLPAKAKLVSAVAASSARIGVMIDAVPASGEPGHYTVNFPVRPGKTRFAFNYDLPYDGRVSFQTRRAYPVQQFAVMIPRSMSFSPRSPGFEVLVTGNGNYQVRAVNELRAGTGPSFELSGTGSFLPLHEETKTQTPSQPSAFPNSKPTGGTPIPSSSAQMGSNLGKTVSPPQLPVWIEVICAVLVVFLLIVWLRYTMRSIRREERVERGPTSAEPSGVLLAGLKNDMFQLETDRIRGSISGQEYVSARQALEHTMKHALSRCTERAPKQDL